MSSPADTFSVVFARAADAAAMAFAYDRPDATVVGAWLARIPEATRTLIGEGYDDGLVRAGPTDATFALSRAGSGKGPYAWFSRNRGPGTPSPNWEYFFQVAEYVRIRSSLPETFEVAIEDGLMDVTVRRDGALVWCVEVKVRAGQTASLLTKLQAYGKGVDPAQPDRGNDALRKAKYLVRHRPPHLSIVGGEERRHFDVAYRSSTSFELRGRRDGPEEAP